MDVDDRELRFVNADLLSLLLENDEEVEEEEDDDEGDEEEEVEKTVSSLFIFFPRSK